MCALYEIWCAICAPYEIWSSVIFTKFLFWRMLITPRAVLNKDGVVLACVAMQVLAPNRSKTRL